MKKIIKNNIDVIVATIMFAILIISGVTLLNTRFENLNQIKDTGNSSYKMPVSTPR